MRDFDEFAAAAARPLLRLGWLLSGSAEQAQDLAQTALVRTYTAWHRVREEDALAYARRVLVNLHTDWLRRRPWREVALAEPPELAAADPGHTAVEERAALIAALQTLSRKERAAVVLRYYADLSERETAQTLGVSVGTVKSVCSRALAKLRASPLLQVDPELARTTSGAAS
ncbi:SigE family RNA polymerase sigma factor [Dactylosporangium sp. AC04546]|uniref:SigE family RNA polymerase sigma factor n=1 Tax=Dactylosporangium sp. AC04546 TaxID=2862460 RepID=UPI001EDF205D|nr:SigE family RNA polymerase sigma factor [Dactylosporangium sp. AC04546]WVK85535.1 SigE family RNA polymerase sigma factor [Dactylosporangium sp. AC04546]